MAVKIIAAVWDEEKALLSNRSSRLTFSVMDAFGASWDI